MGILNIEIVRAMRNGARASFPQKQSAGAAAYDLHAFLEAPLLIEPGARALIPTGLRIALPEGAMALILARSGLAIKHGVALSNGVGLIDSDYRGELLVGLTNGGDRPFCVQDGDRVAQLLLMLTPDAAFIETEELEPTGRGAGGLGSTGVR